MAGQFDNRYEYDQIYPRGRSGETLRAVDLRDNRLVVIKRPAPQDAPPLRAAQEVSILAEKKALERLTGHASLTELRGSGTFRAGGNSYTYIVMDRAIGETVESMVLDLAAQNKRPPELEMLVIVDRLLDLLAAAHAQHVVYNDVDAKHLFWDRENYRLKVIDWGNAVMVDEVGHNPAITFSSDIYQVGELLYFVYQGGARLSSETTSEGQYVVNFNGAMPDAIRDIITQATHPNTKGKRFSTMRSLRDALSTYRQPLERQRDQILQAVQSRLTDHASKQLLETLDVELDAAFALDPGHPTANRLRKDIRLQLQHLAVQADFDAARIYLETGNWARAIRLIEELIPNADPQTAQALTFLVAAAEQFQASRHNVPPDDFGEVMNSVLDGNSRQAARILMAIAEHDRQFKQDALLVAERLAAILPDVVLLRPHLARLEYELARLGSPLAEEVGKIPRHLNSRIAAGIAPLIDRYAKLAIQLADWMPDFERLDGLALVEPAERAEAAAHQIVDYLRRVSDAAYTYPETARNSIEFIRQIDPSNGHIGELRAYIEDVQESVRLLGKFRPKADGSDIDEWVRLSLESLHPYDISDRGFLAIEQKLDAVRQNWFRATELVIVGRKTRTVELLEKTAELIRPHNTNVADWFQKTAQLVADSKEVERFAANQQIADRLLEGYRAWDQGQAGRAADNARNARSLAKTDGEQLAVQRLGYLSEITAQWLTEDGVHSTSKTSETEKAAFSLLLDDEVAEYERFSRQMPSEELYLKAMKLGIVSFMQKSSSVGYRALFLHYVMRGVLEIREGNLEAADFWRETALTVNPQWKTHPLFTAFDGELTSRKLVLRAESALNSIQSWDDLPDIKQALNAPLADKWLKDAQQAITLSETALRQWVDGDFRAVRDSFNQALEHLEAAETAGNMRVDVFRNWLIPYRDRSVELMERRQIVEQAAMAGSLENDPAVLRALEQIVDISEATLGAEYSRQVKLWRDLYRAMLKTHLNQRLEKREKVAEFDGHFSALFIEKHPAYRLFKRWQDAARALPEDVQEELQIDLDGDTTTEAPLYEEDGEVAEKPRKKKKTAKDTTAESPIFDEDDVIIPRRPVDAEVGSSGRSWNIIIMVAGLILVALVGFAAFQILTREDEPNLSGFDATPTRNVLSPAEATQTAEARGVIILPTNTPIPPTATENIASPTARPVTTTPIPPTATENIIPTVAPTLTPSPIVTIVTNTPPPTVTPTPITPTATIVEVASDVGDQVDVLDIMRLIQPDDYGWDSTFFSRGAGDVWQLGASVEEAGSAPIAVVIDADFMETFNPDTASRLKRVDIDMELTLYDEDRLAGGGVFFGMGLQNERRQRYSAQVNVRQPGVVSLGINENGTFRSISQIPLSPIEVRLSLERNPNGSLTFFINGQLLGESPALYPLDESISLVLYHAGGGMFVSVSSLTLELYPYVPE